MNNIFYGIWMISFESETYQKCTMDDGLAIVFLAETIGVLDDANKRPN